jgi:predicted GTPase
LDHGLPFLGFKLQAQKWRLYVHINSRNKRKFRKTMDTIQKTNQNSFTRVDRKRLNSVIESRKWLFKHTKNWERYLGVSSSITTCS